MVRVEATNEARGGVTMTKEGVLYWLLDQTIVGTAFAKDMWSPPRRRCWSRSTTRRNLPVRVKSVIQKRRRIGKRREYEAEQLLESTKSCNEEETQFFKPGQPVTLDRVLGLSKIPR